jgi:hypothetical protein
MLRFKFKPLRVVIVLFLTFGWMFAAEASAKASSSIVCDTHQVNGGDQAFLMSLNTPLEFGGTIYDGNIYVSPKGTVTFGQGDYTFWDYPATPSISIAAFDYHAFANGVMWGAQNDLYVRYGSTATSICVDWKVMLWGQSSGDPIYIRMIAEVNPENYTWTPTFQVSSNAPAGARYGVRYVQGGEVFPLTIQTITEPPAPNPVIEPTPEPTPTEEPTPEPTPSEPEPTPTPVEPETPNPVETPTPTPTPSPEQPNPVAPEPEPTPDPTESPTPQPVQPLPTPTPSEPAPVVPIVPPTQPVVPEPETSLEPQPEPAPQPQPQETVSPVPPTTEPVAPSPELPSKETITSAQDLPEVISPAQLMQVDLSQIVGTDLTVVQAKALIEAALAVFETAEQGTPEYQQALDALFLAAQQDDIVLDEALAAIPLLGDALSSAVELINFLGNAGADMSPQVREQSEKTIIAAVIVAQIALSAVSMAGIATTVNLRSGA